MPDPAGIEVEGLTKRFGHVTALAGLDLRVEHGRIHGFLGPNGAGKTTTIRVLLGAIRADAGRVAVLGTDPWGEPTALRGRLAFVPGEVDLWGSLTGRETLSFLASLRGGVDSAEEARLVERFELDLSRRVADYSKGNRQKVALVAALASGAELFLFDEPTDGLDPLMVRAFGDEVASLRHRGAAVLLSSHVLSEVEELCDDVTIVRSGRAVTSGPITSLQELALVHVRATTRRDPGDVASIRGVSGATRGDGTFECDVSREALDRVLGALHDAEVLDLECRPPSLETIFLERLGSTDSHT